MTQTKFKNACKQTFMNNFNFYMGCRNTGLDITQFLGFVIKPGIFLIGKLFNWKSKTNKYRTALKACTSLLRDVGDIPERNQIFMNACVKCVNILQMKCISWLVVKLTSMNNLISSPEKQGFTLHLNHYQTKKNAVFYFLVTKIKSRYVSRNVSTKVLPCVQGSE